MNTFLKGYVKLWVTTLQVLVVTGLVQADIWSLFAASIVVVDYNGFSLSCELARD